MKERNKLSETENCIRDVVKEGIELTEKLKKYQKENVEKRERNEIFTRDVTDMRECAFTCCKVKSLSLHVGDQLQAHTVFHDFADQ